SCPEARPDSGRQIPNVATEVRLRSGARHHDFSDTLLASRWVGLDILAGPGLFGRAWSRLCAGYVADAIGRKPTPWRRLDGCAALEVLAQGQAEPAPAVGLGEEHRLSSARLAGAGLVAQGRVAHLMAFPAAEALETNQ
ncbi:MAG: ARPP-1 family domain-containing protein, partial [Dehalococcoidia bacterium]